MQIRELMRTDVLSCHPEDSLHRAAQLMWDGDVGAIPVVDGELRLQGIITDRDICMAAYTQGCTLDSRAVGGAMSQPVQTCAPGESAQLAEERMRKFQVRRLPVVEAGKLIGMLSLNDLALAAGERKSAKGAAPGLEDVATTLARISEHRPRSVAAAE